MDRARNDSIGPAELAQSRFSVPSEHVRLFEGWGVRPDPRRHDGAARRLHPCPIDPSPSRDAHPYDAANDPKRRTCVAFCSANQATSLGSWSCERPSAIWCRLRTPSEDRSRCSRRGCVERRSRRGSLETVGIVIWPTTPAPPSRAWAPNEMQPIWRHFPCLWPYGGRPKIRLPPRLWPNRCQTLLQIVHLGRPYRSFSLQPADDDARRDTHRTREGPDRTTVDLS